MLWPGHIRRDQSRANKNRLRDAMHIATTIAYGHAGFVTSERKLLRCRDEIRAAFDGFLILSPSEALAVAEHSP
jgi:hypothetical protein